MEDNKLLNTKLDDEIYQGSKLPFKRSTLVLFALFIFAFLAYFPVKKIIKSQIAASLGMIRTCPISYKDIDISFIFPKITLIKPVVSGICFQRPGKSLKLNNLPISVSIPSFSPPGLRLFTRIQKGKTKLDIYPTLSFATHKIRLKDSKIDTSILAEFNNGVQIVKGDLDLNAYAVIRKNKIAEGDVLVTSKDLSLPSQDFGFFKLTKTINLGALQVKAKMDNSGTINLMDTFVGGIKSPFAVKLSGKIIFNQNNPHSSKLDLKGGIKFSKQFLEDYSIISLFLGLDGKQANAEGFFDLRIQGTLGVPKPKVL